MPKKEAETKVEEPMEATSGTTETLTFTKAEVDVLMADAKRQRETADATAKAEAKKLQDQLDRYKTAAEANEDALGEADK